MLMLEVVVMPITVSPLIEVLRDRLNLLLIDFVDPMPTLVLCLFRLRERFESSKLL
jgi:hypothetical protein